MQIEYKVGEDVFPTLEAAETFLGQSKRLEWILGRVEEWLTDAGVENGAGRTRDINKILAWERVRGDYLDEDDAGES